MRSPLDYLIIPFRSRGAAVSSPPPKYLWFLQPPSKAHTQDREETPPPVQDQCIDKSERD
jgi:hypothetical protein